MIVNDGQFVYVVRTLTLAVKVMNLGVNDKGFCQLFQQFVKTNNIKYILYKSFDFQINSKLPVQIVLFSHLFLNVI